MDALWKEEKMPYLPYFSVACYTNTVFFFFFLLYRKIAIALQTCFGTCVETPVIYKVKHPSQLSPTFSLFLLVPFW